MMPLYKSLKFCILLLISSSSILAFRYSIFLFLKCLLASCLALLRLAALLWFDDDDADAKTRAQGRLKKNWMEGIKKAMNKRNLKEGQWEDRKQWSLGVRQRRKTF
jgi:hypothetical protein